MNICDRNGDSDLRKGYKNSRTVKARLPVGLFAFKNDALQKRDMLQKPDYSFSASGFHPCAFSSNSAPSRVTSVFPAPVAVMFPITCTSSTAETFS